MLLDNLNYLTLAIFAPILVLVGILGFIIPPPKSLTSGATPYNVFHILFGVLGALIVLSGYEGAMRAFNIGFGLIDLYQAVASFANLFPKQYFQWNIVIGGALVLIGIFGR